MESDTEENTEKSVNEEIDNIKDSERSILDDSEFIEKSTDISRIEEDYSAKVNEIEGNKDEETFRNLKDENGEIKLNIKVDEELKIEDEINYEINETFKDNQENEENLNVANNETDVKENINIINEEDAEETEDDKEIELNKENEEINNKELEVENQEVNEGELDMKNDNIMNEKKDSNEEIKYQENDNEEEVEMNIIEDQNLFESEHTMDQIEENKEVSHLLDGTETGIRSILEDNINESDNINYNYGIKEKEYKDTIIGELEQDIYQQTDEEFMDKADQINQENDSILDLKDISEETNEQIKGSTDLKNIGVTNFFTVPIQLDDGSVKNQLVTIIKSKSKKPYLGGYRHKLSEKEYHHAAVQTLPKPRLPPKVQLFSRDTQTFQLKHQKINTENTTSTQMTKPGIYVSNVTDKLHQIKQYETAVEYRERMLGNIIIIQKYYRRWLAKQIVEEKRKQRDDRLQWENNDQERKQKEKEERINNEYKKRMHPKTKADFDLLYSDLEKWREEQLQEIENSNLTIAEMKAKKALLLDEETDLLAAIDRHKIDRKGESKIEAVQKLLSKAAAPKSWKDPKGRKIEMDTQFTIRSRELLEIFNSLNMQYLTSDERLDVLLTLKHTVKEHDCKLTKEIVELVNREADLIMRNMKDASLAGLRKRISTLFLQYCKTPTFNPQISLLLRVPPDPMVLVGDINYCKYCGRYLRSTEFSLSTKSSKLTTCKSCARKDNQSRNRQDYSHYRRILKEIQMNEQKIDDQSKVVFIFKQNDVKCLIESVWDGKSILSGCDDLDELVFLRWDRKEHWSPWNTIFITKDEAEAHLKVTNLTDTYSKVLINRVLQKHVIARNIFGSLEKMVDDFQSKSLKATIKI